TWFSSALWPHATLGWPQQTPELQYFYPTDVLVTAREILYLWVARMIMTGLRFVGEIPFHDVYIYATVLNWEGKRMSKSLGTGIDPLDLTRQYGTDATRFALLMQAGKTQDMRFDDGRRRPGDPIRAPLCETSRNFANKLWNAARFVLMNVKEEDVAAKAPVAPLQLADRWILSRLARTVHLVNEAFAEYSFDEAAKTLYTFLWNEYCDWYVELAKPRLRVGDAAARQVLVHVLDQALRLLHPMMPFITEEIWQKLPGASESIMVAAFPEPDASRLDPAAEQAMQQAMEVTTTLRQMRAEMGVPSTRPISTAILSIGDDGRKAVDEWIPYLQTLARVEEVRIESADAVRTHRQALSANVAGVHVLVPLAGLVDIDVEVRRLTAELETLHRDIERLERKLSNQDYLSKAPAAVVEKDHRRRQELEERSNTLRQRLEVLQG
ncbi:MAG: class I tRNA ligase family protein, partial [Armatimonadota bacterium]|nr:class I tRNA ligase family protein [Armatimonadota bacterium]